MLKHNSNIAPFIERLLLVILAVILLWVCFQAHQIILITFAGGVVAVVLGGCAQKMAAHLSWPKEAHRYIVSLWMVALMFFGILSAGFYFVGPRIAKDIKQLETEVPNAVESIKDFPPVQAYLNNGDDGLSEEQINSITSAASSTIQSLLSGTFRITSALVIIIFVGLFGAAHPKLYKDAACSFFPKSLRHDCDHTLRACVDALWDWLKGQGLAMLLIGTLSVSGLLLIDVRYALTLGIIAGLFQFVPYLGPIASALPALLVAITMSPQTALWVALLYIGIQFAEGNFITPLVMKREANLPPLATLLSTVFFGAVFGVIGVVVATPLAVILMTLKQEIYEKRILQSN